MSATEYLDRLLEPVSLCLTPEVAERLIHVPAPPGLQDRMDELADKCTEGSLNEAERSEYETYVRAVNFIGVLQAKARRLLAVKGS
jgi:hypothetical protein